MGEWQANADGKRGSGGKLSATAADLV